jgi:hypothetical protein
MGHNDRMQAVADHGTTGMDQGHHLLRAGRLGNRAAARAAGEILGQTLGKDAILDRAGGKALHPVAAKMQFPANPRYQSAISRRGALSE